ncbi:ArnT family glycosyltransferase [Phycisphaera mikurensis]|uniref:ArnT family glycosyltransferase n=1 Tax=Phycisphaera mikurensis TaxID=547188 RepID=UPI0012B5A5D1|nr:hypothetical protein [Phycisphaera mikurensis]MBB6441871.1 4-amino-4-deoxy-L-arabinose transferase-like glycosyltransferase [Phycisphaera mikurensis]
MPGTPVGGGAPAELRASGLWDPVRRGTAFLIAAGVFLAVLALSLAFPNPTPQTDEYYHLLVSRSLEAGRGLRITPEAAPYDRAWLFSLSVYASQQLFGATLGAARIPGALAWAATAGLVAWTLSRRGGLVAALIAAGALGLAVHTLMFSSMVRFYTPQALFVLLAALTLDRTLREWKRGRRGRAAGWLTAASVAAALGLLMQPTTLVPAFAASIWCGLVGLVAWWGWPVRRRAVSAGVTAAVVGLAAAGMWFGGLPGYIDSVTSDTAVWAESNADNTTFYTDRLGLWYRPFWLLLPLWAAAAVLRGGPSAAARRRGLAFFLVMGLVPLLVHSLVPTKAFRYLLYAVPFLFGAAALGMAEALRGVALLVLAGVRTLGSGVGLGRPAARAAGVAAAALAVLLVVGYGFFWRSPGIARGVQMLAGDLSGSPFQRSDWAAASAVLRPRVERAGVVIASAGNKSLWFFGRLDLTLSVALDVDKDPDWLQPQDGRPVITEPEELAAARAAHATGLVIVEDEHWRTPAFVTDAAADWLEASCRPIDLPPGCRLRAFAWGPDPEGDPAEAGAAGGAAGGGGR